MKENKKLIEFRLTTLQLKGPVTFFDKISKNKIIFLFMVKTCAKLVKNACEVVDAHNGGHLKEG